MQSTRITEVLVQVPGGSINADLVTPANSRGLIILPLGDSSGRSSVRDECVAQTLHESGLATLTVHLLLPTEAAREISYGDGVPEREILRDRLQRACRCVGTAGPVRPVPLAVCGIGADAGLALWIAALEPQSMLAAATLGGRPDLVPADVLARVRAATLLVLGSSDPFVVDACRAAARDLRAPTQVAVVPGATHAFSDAQHLAIAAQHAATWFSRQLGRSTYRPPIAEEADVD